MNDEYKKEHVCCPECGSTSLEQTCGGFMNLQNKDENQVNCVCGWKGIVDDLIPDRMSAKRLRDIYKSEVKVDPNKPETWDNEMVADYFLWILNKRSQKDAEMIMETTIEKWRQ